MENKKTYINLIKHILIVVSIIFLYFLGLCIGIYLTKDLQKDKDSQAVSYTNMSMVQPLQAENDVINLASPDLTGKEYLGDGVYKINKAGFSYLNYNVYNGLFTVYTPVNSGVAYIWTLPQDTYTITIETDNKGQTFYLAQNGNEFYFNQNTGGTKQTFTFENMTHFAIVRYEGSNEITSFTLQIEKGSTLTPYQTPIGALNQHSQLEYDRGYNKGHTDGFNEGYTDGFNEGLDQVFNPNNLMLTAEKRGKGTTGPTTEYFGFTIPLNIKLDRVTILNLEGYVLKPLSWTGGSNVKQGISVRYSGGSTYYRFEDFYNEYNGLMEILIDETKTIIDMTIILALNNPAMPMPDFERMQDHMLNNLGVYVNNKVITDEAINIFKEIIEADVRYSLDLEYQQRYDALYAYKLSQEWQLGYDEGLADGVKDGGSGIASMLGIFFTSLTFFGGLEVLPGFKLIYGVGIVVMISLIAWLSGRKGGGN